MPLYIPLDILHRWPCWQIKAVLFLPFQSGRFSFLFLARCPAWNFWCDTQQGRWEGTDTLILFLIVGTSTQSPTQMTSTGRFLPMAFISPRKFSLSSVYWEFSLIKNIVFCRMASLPVLSLFTIWFFFFCCYYDQWHRFSDVKPWLHSWLKSH